VSLFPVYHRDNAKEKRLINMATLQINGTTLYVEASGKDAAPVIFLHAGVTDSRMWDTQWETVGEGFNVIRYDRPGYGQSPMSQGLRANRPDLLALMDALQFDRARLVGCSMGGEIATDFTLEHPDRVLSLTLVSSLVSGFEMQGEAPQELFAMFGALEKGDAQAAATIAANMYVVGGQRIAEQVSSDILQSVCEMILGIIQSGAMMQPDANPLTAMTSLSEIQVPTLLVAGGSDHPEILRGVELIAAAIPNSQTSIIPHTAHFPNMEQPDIFNRMLLEFLARVKN
jgi:pimeloyl-ACP methyl ester carboxylesterase